MTLNESAFTAPAYKPSLTIHFFALFITVTYAGYNLAYDSISIGVLILVSGLFLLMATVKFIHKNPSLVCYLLFFLFQIVALSAACHQYGIRGALLMYPVTASIFYVLCFRVAWKLAVLFFLFAFISSSEKLSTDMLIRLSISLGMSIVVAASFAYIVEKQKDTLEYDANHDLLTRILNRRGLLEALQNQIVRARKSNLDTALFFIDLVQFKQVNDIHGHHIGDLLLEAFASRINGSIRGNRFGASETEYVFGRFSGDEFILSFRLNTREQAESIAHRVMDVCKHPFSFEEVEIDLQISIGICFASQANYHFKELISFADQSMYRAKNTGGSAFHFYHG